MPLFQIVSKLDGKTYDIDWGADRPVLRVSQPESASVPAAGWGNHAPMPMT